jgi:dihydrofolate reductase
VKISINAAMAENRVIGIDNKIPWHLSADLKNFKKITMGKPILMGRKTFESIGRPLPGRKNIIISRNLDYQQPGCEVFHSIDTALKSCADSEEIMIIGGSDLYRSMLPKATHLYLTLIHKEFSGDTFFPAFNWNEWQEIARKDITDDGSVSFTYSFIILERIQH